MNPEIDHYLAEGCGRCSLVGTPKCKVHAWTNELKLLRKLVLACGLIEELKWSFPCYTFQNGNVLLVSAFKEYCAISFFKGALLSDSDGILEKPGENSQAVRLLKFRSVEAVEGLASTISAYIHEAIEIEKAGLKVEFKKNPEPMPEELLLKMDEDPVFRAAFEGLTPGRQRGYILHFSQPKQAKTRVDRIEKCESKILNGEGMHDQYKSMKK